VARSPYRLRYGFEFFSGVLRTVNQDINAHVISLSLKAEYAAERVSLISRLPAADTQNYAGIQ
jgi:hypothetical protein